MAPAAAYPLSPMQQGMLFHRLYDGDSGVDVEQMVCSLHEPIDAAALAGAWARVAARHAILRTAFRWQGLAEPEQEPRAEVTIPLNPQDWREAAQAGGAAVEARLAAFLAADRRRGFDLAEPPLLRVALFTLGEAEHLMVWTFHHILLDGRSFPLILNEVFLAHAALRSGEEPAFPLAPRPYRDYIEWLARLDTSRSEAFFREALRGFVSPTPLPFARPPRAGEALEKGEQEITLPAPATAALHALAARAGVTLNTLVQGAFALLLSRHSGETDLVFGVTRACRSTALGGEGTAAMVGLFINTLPLRVSVPPEMALLPWLADLRARFRALRDHEHTPLVKIREWSELPVGAPLFESILVFEDYLLDTRLRAEGHGFERREIRLHEQTNFPLTLAAYGGASLTLRIEHDARRLDAATVARLLGHLATLLGSMVSSPDARLGDLAILPDAERRWLLGAEGDAPPVTTTVHAWFEAQVDRAPDAPAVTCAGTTLSYRELDERGNRLARHLVELGVGPDVLVGLRVPRSLDLVVGVLGILKAGGAYLPLDPDYPEDRLAFMIADARVSLVVTQVEHPEQPGTRLAARGVPGDLAYVIYTSGSTGEPKGALITHANVARLFTATDPWYRFGAADVWTLFHSYAFDFSVWELWGALLHGGRVVVVPYWVSRSPDAFYRLLGDEGVTVLNQTPSAFRQLVHAEADAPPEQLAALRLRYVIFGGEALDLADLRPWWARHGDAAPQLVNMYGITETTVHVTYRPVTAADLERPGASVIGRPLPDLQVHVLDAHGNLAPLGAPGEMFVGGAGVARGYLHRPELTAARFVPDPFRPGHTLYRTGDRARRRPDGDLEYLGRLDHQVKIRGFRVELGEIEAVLAQHPAVREAVVIAREDQPGDRRLVAYLVGDAEAASTLRAFLEAKLPDYMVPAAFVQLDVLPLTANDKIDRAALPAPGAAALGARAHVAPRDPVEEAIAGFYAEILAIPRVGAHDGFFALGGHSLLATRLISRVRSAFGIDLPLRAVFDAPTPAALAVRARAALREGRPREAPPFERAPRDGAIALSYGQERLWFLFQLEPESEAYVVPLLIRLRGDLDDRALERAIAEIVRRHEVLRTTFTTIDRRPAPVIHEGAALPLPVTRLAEAELAAAANAEAKRPFDLTRELPIRARLLELGPADHALFLSLHHIVADAWTVGVLYRELEALYAAFHAGAPSPLAELPIQYADYARWQRRWLGAGELERQLAYWRAQLADLPGALAMPTDHARLPGPIRAGAWARLELSPALTRELRALAQREGVTLYMVLFAAYALVLSRWTGQRDVVVGTPIANRTRAETEGLIGFFLNNLVLRVQLDERLTFRALLGRVKEACLGAYAHQEMPFERLVQELAPERDPHRSPLFQAFFNLQNAPAAPLALPGLEASLIESEGATTKFELTLIVTELPDRLLVALSYAADLFDGSTIERLLAQLETLLESARRAPERPLRELEMLPASELHRLLVAWNDTAVAYPPGETVPGLFEAQVDRTPLALAVVADDARLTFRELDARANRLARRLRALGVGRDAPVGLCLDRQAALVVGLLGILKAGGAYLPLDPAHPTPRLAALLAEASATLVVTRATLAARLPDGARAVLLDDDAVAESDARLDAVADPRSLVYVLFTSGSTGAPKGVAVEHRSLVNYVRGVSARLALPEGSSYAHVSTFSADLGHTALFPPLCLGGTLHLVGDETTRDPDGLAAYFAREGVDCLKIVPSHLAALLRAARPEQVLPRRLLVLGGEGASWELVARIEQLAPDLRILNHYGPTEATVGALTSAIERGRRVEDTAIVPLGRPLPNARIYLLDPEGRPSPIGAVGEIFLGGAGVARGYLGRPELTAERFLADPFAADPEARMYRTGDRGRYLEDGALTFLGRLDHQVKIRGFRVELGEIEAAILATALVKEAAVLAVDDGAGEKKLVAFVVEEDALARGALRGELEARLPDHLIPAAFVALAALPLTANGKVDRRALAAIGAPPADAIAAHVAPRSPVEEVLAGIWADVFREERLGVHERFADLGGHSLLAIQIIARAREAFQIDLPLRALFEAPTIAGLAERIEQIARADEGLAEPPITRAPRDAALPLSFSQERLWVLDQLEPGSAAYNVPAALHLEGELDARALERALGEVLRRHEVLRTTFSTVEGRPIQVIHEGAALHLPVEDVAASLPEGAAARAEFTRQLALAEARRPFDLARGPLSRARLLRLGEREHLLLWTLHHIVSDAWTRGILNRELGQLYEAFRDGRPSPLAELPIQYADYARWQRATRSGDASARQLAYWKNHLAGAPAALELPADRPRPPVQSHRGGARDFTLPPELAQALRALARREGATLFMTALAAFYVLLYRTTTERDLVIGTPVANRPRAELWGLVGFFINTLVLRVQLTPDQTFVELLAAVREACLSGYAHQDLPFERLVQELSPARDLARAPLFQVMFMLQSAPPSAIALPGLTIRPEVPPSGTAKFDLTFSLSDLPTGMLGAVEYSADLFDPATIDRMIDHYRELLAAITSAPDARLGALSILAPAERATLLEGFNATAFDHGTTADIPDLFEAQVERTPDAIAVSFEGRELTYRELDRRANQVAHALQRRGVGADVLVGVCMERSLELVVALCAVLKAGGAYVPLDPDYPKARLAFMLEDARVPVLITQARLAGALPAHDAAVLELDAALRAVKGEPSSRPARDPSLDRLAYAIFTSGSTGRPKGALNAHRGIQNRLLWMRRVHGLTAADRVLQKTPFGFDISVWELFWPLICGARLVVARPEGHKDPAYLVDLLERESITAAHFVPSMLNAFLDALEGRRLSSLKRVFCSGEALPPATAARFFQHLDAELHNLYGPTEAAVEVTAWRCEPGASVVPIGRPIDNTRIYLLDDGGEPVPIGVRGELFIGGVQVGLGYLGRPELTAERFVRDPFTPDPKARLYRTGDVARFRPDGAVEYLGRVDHQVKIRGFRVELGEIEAVLARHPAVREAVVAAREGDPGALRLVAYLVCPVGPAPTTPELRAFLKEELPEHMVPAAFVLLEALPLLSNGKIDRKALPAPEASPRPALGEGFVAPRDPLERALAAIWAAVLRATQVGVHDNFFELGGDSILGIQIVSRARAAGIRLTPRQLFESQTIAELAAAADTTVAAEAEQGAVTGAAPLTPIQRWWLEQDLGDRDHFNQAFFLEARAPLDPDALERALARLLEHHDALRVRLTGAEQRFVAPGEPLPFARVSLRDLPEPARASALLRAATDAQASLDLERGPALRVLWFDLGEGRPSRLFVVVHHLAVDAVSWGILLEDLWAAYEHARRGDAATLPPKTTSFQRWAERLAERARGAAVAAEKGYWLAPSRAIVRRLPVDHARGDDTEATLRSVSVSLTPAETDALLREVPEAYRTQINDVLLAAFALAMTRFTGEPRVLVDLEGHGREELFEDVDVTRTVGWFTAIFPVLLELPASAGPAEALTTVKEQLRAVPGRGLGYGLLRYLREGDGTAEALAAMPQAEVSFNYLGRFESAAGAPLAILREPVGPSRSPKAKRRYLLEVRATVAEERLEVRWAYSEARHREETIARLAEQHLAALRGLIAHCLSPEAGGYTPSDFTKAKLSQGDLEDIVGALDEEEP